MNENYKFNETKYFLNRLLEEKEHIDSFKYNLSAFLSSSRSILQYMYEETKGKSIQNWYDNYVNSSNLIQFFRNKRNYEIHSGPVNPSKNVIISVPSVNIIVNLPFKNGKDRNEERQKISDIMFRCLSGQIISEEEKKLIESCTFSENQIGEGGTESTYFFNDWTGNEDLISLCSEYVGELRLFIDEGINKGYISG